MAGAVAAALFGMGCEVDDSQYRPIDSSGARVMSPPNAANNAVAHAVLHNRQSIEKDPLLGFLEARGVSITDMGYGRFLIANDARARHALRQWLRIGRQRMEVIAANIANQDSLYDATGNYAPYRRRKVVIDDAGVGHIQIDDSAPVPVVYNPDHPEADANGFVTESNVVVELEEARADSIARQFESAVKLLLQFDSRVSRSDPMLATPSLNDYEVMTFDHRGVLVPSPLDAALDR